jgi:hypothetical protein
LCVQRDMENNTCQGQCFLMKKLKNQQEKEQQNFKINFQESLAVNPHLFLSDIVVSVPIQKKVYGSFTSNLNPRDFIYTLDRPPLLG